jgi:hypothetical protein
LLTVGLALASACTQTRVNVDESQRQVTARTEAGQEVVYRFGAIPQSWRRIDMSEGADVAWDAQNGNVVHVDHACGRSMDSPLPALVQQMLIGFEAREFVEEETIAFDGREARHVLVRARLDGRPIVIELYVLKKDGCVFDLSATGEPSHFDSVRPEFQAFAQGFRSERTPLDQGPEQRR